MDSYTHINLREVEDSAPKFGIGEHGSVRFPLAALGAQRTGLSLQSLRPGKRQPFVHHHDEAEEVYVVLSGSGRVKLDDVVVELAALDAVRVAPEVVRAFEAGDDGLEILVFGTRHEGDGTIEQDPSFWGE